MTSQLILNNKNPIKHNNNKNQFKCWHQTRENFATKLNKDLGNGCFKEKLFKGKDVKYFWTFRNAYFSKNGLNTKETVFWFRNFKIIEELTSILRWHNRYTWHFQLDQNSLAYLSITEIVNWILQFSAKFQTSMVSC